MITVTLRLVKQSHQSLKSRYLVRHFYWSCYHCISRSDALVSYQMCIVIFSVASCSCPPTPTCTYLRLCPKAKSHNLINACPQGQRRSETLRYPSMCLWCKQCGKESEKKERSEWMKARLGSQGREKSTRQGLRLREEVAKTER
jgi:hypothetical protein